MNLNSESSIPLFTFWYSGYCLYASNASCQASSPMGGIAIPPIGEDAWQDAFDAYKQYPEYQKVNKGMELSEFKFIYYWEYGHRLLGRIIGLIFFVPLLVLISLKMIS